MGGVFCVMSLPVCLLVPCSFCRGSLLGGGGLCPGGLPYGKECAVRILVECFLVYKFNFGE